LFFINYRNTALTHWSRQEINVDIAMLASGHSSVQMPSDMCTFSNTTWRRHLAQPAIENGYTARYKKTEGIGKQLILQMEKEGARWCRWSSKPVWGP
jgi:hypothetical protein